MLYYAVKAYLHYVILHTYGNEYDHCLITGEQLPFKTNSVLTAKVFA